MSNPQLVKVFLASSITELEKERQELSALGDDISNIFPHDEIVVRIVKCENFHAGHVGPHDQEYIDGKLRGCDISLFVFKTTVGEWTRHEYAVARRLHQEQQKHRLFVYFLGDPAGEKDPSVEDFQQQLIKDGVYWKYYNTASEIKYKFLVGILNHLGITVGGRSAEAEAEAKDADERFEQFEQGEAQQQQLMQKQQQRRQQLHQDIDDLLAQIPDVLADESQLVSTRIVEVMGLYQKADRWASKTDYDKEKYSDLLFDYAQFLNKYGMYYDAEAVWLRQIPLAEELYGQEHKNTAASYNNIGSVYWKQGDYPKALEYYGKALAIVEKVLGKDHPDTATTYNNIGTVYDDQGDYPKALEYYKKALAIREKVLPKDHPDTASSYNNIGLVYDNQGDYPKALEYYGKALAIDEKVLGKDHPDTATDYNNIGFMYYQQGKYPEALEYLEKALEIFKARLGDDHPNTKGTQRWIALTKAAMG